MKDIAKTYRVIGIDLGTTNSSVAEIIWQSESGEPAQAKCLEVDQWTTAGIATNVLVPSFVTLYRGREIVGEGAKQLRALITDPNHTLEQYKSIFFECKNDMGTQRTYHKAPAGYRSAAEISGKILKFLNSAGMKETPVPIDRTVVTVPASFQAAQRSDTIKAAELAGMSLAGGDLLDEPVAAFLDYLVSTREKFNVIPGPEKNLLVFDFGGGTCDIAIFQIQLEHGADSLHISPKSVSRYHRLGGGDIDAAILYNVLLPQILKQNDVGEFDLTFENKKKRIEPSFIGIAEGLKIGLCKDINRLKEFGVYDGKNKTEIKKIFPGTNFCLLADGRQLKLNSPELTAQQFEELLVPFLDPDLTYARETEYQLTCSMYAPLQDAIERAGIYKNKIDYCLLVGGSCLIPQVVESLKGYLSNSILLTYKDIESLQTAVARGAAYHALALARNGKGLIQPVCHDAIAIRTKDGLYDLIPKGVKLPYPTENDYKVTNDLSVPKTVLLGHFNLSLEIVARDDERILMRKSCLLPGPINQGDRLCIKFRYDANQLLSLQVSLADNVDSPVYDFKKENPLTNVVNPQTTKLKIDELEEKLRKGEIPKDQQIDKMIELAENYSELRQHEKAIAYLQTVMRQRGPDANILNKMAIYCGEIGDFEKQEKFYREAANVSSRWGGSLFNLALSQKNRKKYVEAIQSIEAAIQREDDPPYLVLRAQLAEAVGDQKKRDTYLSQALAEFEPLPALNDWALGWYLTASIMVHNTQNEQLAREEQRRRKPGLPTDPDGELPQGIRTLQRGE